MENGAGSYHCFRIDSDESGLVEIIHTYRDGLILYLNSIVHDLNIAEELAEDTFVLLGTKKPKDKGTASFKTWLYIIGHNLAINHLRQRARRSEVSLDDCLPLADEYDLEVNYIKRNKSARYSQRCTH